MSTISHVQETGSILADQRHELIADATLTRDTAEAEDRDLTAAESAHIKECLDRAKKVRQMPLYKEWGALPQPQISSLADPSDDGLGNRGSRFSPAGPSTSAVPGSAKYGSLFGKPQGNGGFRSLGEFLATLNSGLLDNRLRATQFETVDSGGGFLVPEVFAQQMLDASLEDEIVRPRAQVHPMSSDKLRISGFDNLDHSTHLYGGFACEWVSEGETQTVETAAVRRITLNAKKMFLLTQSSNELLTDAVGFERLLGEAMIAACAWFLDFAFLTGNGSGRPLGVLHDPALITVNKEAAQTATTVWYTNIVRMFARLHPGCYKTAIWVANPTCIPQLLQLNFHDDTAGSGSLVGDGVYQVFHETNGQFTLFGRPVIFTEKLPALGTVGDLLLADFSQYSIGLRREMSVERSGHVGFADDSSYFRTILRADGQGRWASAITPRNGDSLSWCIALETRD